MDTKKQKMINKNEGKGGNGNIDKDRKNEANIIEVQKSVKMIKRDKNEEQKEGPRGNEERKLMNMKGKSR